MRTLAVIIFVIFTALTSCSFGSDEIEPGAVVEFTVTLDPSTGKVTAPEEFRDAFNQYTADQWAAYIATEYATAQAEMIAAVRDYIEADSTLLNESHYQNIGQPSIELRNAMSYDAQITRENLEQQGNQMDRHDGQIEQMAALIAALEIEPVVIEVPALITLADHCQWWWENMWPAVATAGNYITTLSVARHSAALGC